MNLDVGCGQSKREGFTGLDRVALPGVDLVHDLERFPWPVESDSVEHAILDNVIEHLPDTVGTFNELWRIVKPGGRVEMIYPYYRSFGTHGDPTHVRYFNEYLIDYFLKPGSTPRNENRYAFYSDRHWRLVSRRLLTYPGLGWLPMRLLSFIARHGPDVVHGVHIVIEPDKP